MSTWPRDPSNAANVTPVITPAQHDQQVDAAVHEFVLVAAELDIARPSASELPELCRQVADLSADLFSSEIAIGVRGEPRDPR